MQLGPRFRRQPARAYAAGFALVLRGLAYSFRMLEFLR